MFATSVLCVTAALNPEMRSPGFSPRSLALTTIVINPLSGSYLLSGSAGLTDAGSTKRPSVVPPEFGEAMYDSKLGVVPFQAMCTPRILPSGIFIETYHAEAGGCGFWPGSV